MEKPFPIKCSSVPKAGKEMAGYPAGTGTPPPPCLHPAAEPDSKECFALKDCQTLLKTRLSRSLLKLFQELTGLRIHLLWQTPLDLLRPTNESLACPTARQKHNGGDGQCRLCQQRRWRAGTQTTSDTRRFEGECGVTNFWAAIHVGTNCPLKLVLQANVAEANARSRPRRQIPPAINPKAFNHAAALLEMILHDLQATVHDEMAQAELGQSRRRLQNLECELSQLRLKLHQRIPELSAVAANRPAAGSRARQHVEAVLDHLHQNYHRPMGLKDVAASFKLNPDYLAHLFAQTVGLKFHDYLQELRLAKAGELLRDPRRNICDVAGATGFASVHHFRHAFKARLGVAPSVWRNGT